MRAVDANVFVRLFVQDDPAQNVAAQRIIGSGPIFIPKTVIIEFEWVLRGAYAQSRPAIAAAIDGLVASADVEIEDATAIVRAVEWFKRGMDLADALHLASSAHVDDFLTFDAAFRRRAARIGATPLVTAP